METLPIDLTFLVVSHLSDPEDMENLGESTPQMREYLNDLNRWNSLFKSEFGMNLTIRPARIYEELRKRKEKAQKFIRGETFADTGVLLNGPDLSYAVSKQLLQWIVNDPEKRLHFIKKMDEGSCLYLNIYSSGMWRIVSSSESISTRGTMRSEILEKVLIVISLYRPNIV